MDSKLLKDLKDAQRESKDSGSTTTIKELNPCVTCCNNNVPTLISITGKLKYVDDTDLLDLDLNLQQNNKLIKHRLRNYEWLFLSWKRRK